MLIKNKAEILSQALQFIPQNNDPINFFQIYFEPPDNMKQRSTKQSPVNLPKSQPSQMFGGSNQNFFQIPFSNKITSSQSTRKFNMLQPLKCVVNMQQDNEKSGKNTAKNQRQNLIKTSQLQGRYNNEQEPLLLSTEMQNTDEGFRNKHFAPKSKPKGNPYALLKGNQILKNNFQVTLIKNNKKHWIVRKLKNQKKYGNEILSFDEDNKRSLFLQQGNAFMDTFDRANGINLVELHCSFTKRYSNSQIQNDLLNITTDQFQKNKRKDQKRNKENSPDIVKDNPILQYFQMQKNLPEFQIYNIKFQQQLERIMFLNRIMIPEGDILVKLQNKK